MNLKHELHELKETFRCCYPITTNAVEAALHSILWLKNRKKV